MVHIHELKCHPGPFEAVWTGKKTAEFRKFDRPFVVGDILLLREWDGLYSGRELRAKITHILTREFGVPEGYAMLSMGTP